MLRRFFYHSLATVLIAILTLVTFFPFLSRPTSLITDDSDGLFTVWVLHQMQENILGLKPLFGGNIFYPQENTLLFSDPFVTTSLLLLPIRLFTDEPVVLFTFCLIISQFLSTILLYFLITEVLTLEDPSKRRGEKHFWLALCGAIIFCFSQIHLHYSGHLHVFSLPYVLLGMVGIVRFFKTNGSQWLIVATISAILQFWNSIFLTYYLIFFAILWLFSSKQRKQIRKQMLMVWKTVLLCTGVFLLCALPLTLSYLQVFQTQDVVRDIREVIHFSLKFPQLTGQFFSPVLYTITGLSVLALLSQLRKGTVSRFAILFFIASILIFILALGPALHIGEETVKFSIAGRTLHVPLPYTLFYYGAPGFQAFRTPSRFLPLSFLFATIACTFVCKNLNLSIRYIRLLCIGGICATLLVYPPLPQIQLPNTTMYPPYVSVLKKLPGDVIIELPIRDWADPKSREDVYAMLYSTYHQKTLVNGQSGFFPTEWLLFQHSMRDFPQTSVIQALKSRGVDLVVIRKKYFSRGELITATKQGKTVYEDPSILILDITRYKSGV